MHPRWEHFRHGADIGVRGTGATPAEAFEQAALALTAIVTPPPKVRAQRSLELACSAPDLELLLVDWLNLLIFHMAAESFLFSRCEVRLDDAVLRAHAFGEPLEVARHQPAVEPKAATYTALEVREREDGTWLAQCVVDV
jgi:SHS2 domain-containing protein